MSYEFIVEITVSRISKYSRDHRNCVSVGDLTLVYHLQEKVLDRRTRILLLKMVNSGVIKQVNGIVSTGKESVIIHCNGGRLATFID